MLAVALPSLYQPQVLGYTELFNFQNKQISGLPSHLFNEFQDDPEGLADQLNTLLTGEFDPGSSFLPN